MYFCLIVLLLKTLILYKDNVIPTNICSYIHFIIKYNKKIFYYYKMELHIEENIKEKEEEKCNDCSIRKSNKKQKKKQKIKKLLMDRKDKRRRQCFYCNTRKEDLEKENQEKIDYCYTNSGSIFDNICVQHILSGLAVGIPVALVLKTLI